MEETSRNVAIVSSVIYGVLLLCGWIFFSFTFRGEPLYSIKPPHLATFYVFVFAFLPSLFFLGGTVPWMCAAYGSEAATIVFAVVPGGVFALVALSWIFLGDLVLRDVPKDPMTPFVFQRDTRAEGFDGRYPEMAMTGPQGVYVRDAQFQQRAGTAAYVAHPGTVESERDQALASIFQQGRQVSFGPSQPRPLPMRYGGTRGHNSSSFPAEGEGAGPWVAGGLPPASVMTASLADGSGTTASVGLEGHMGDSGLMHTPPPQQQRASVTRRLVPSPFPRSGGSTSGRRRLAGSPEIERRTLWLDSDEGDSADNVVLPEPLFIERFPGEEEAEVYLDAPFNGR